MMNDQSHQDLLAVCKTFNQGMLITHDSDGSLRGRPMYIAQLEEDGDMWFATSLASGKVDEIRNDSHVCVAMAGDGSYVSISGKAVVVKDRAKIDSLWSETWKVWFPKGKDDPELALIQVQATEGEFWSQSGIHRVKYLLSAAKAYANGTKPQPDPSINARVSL